MSQLPEGHGWDLQVKPKAKPAAAAGTASTDTPPSGTASPGPAPPNAPSADGTELSVTSKAPKPSGPASSPGGAEELPGSPRPKPKQDKADKAAAAASDHARQRPGALEEDAEIWVDPRKGGKGWVTPSGFVAPEPGQAAKSGAAGAPGEGGDGPVVEEDEDTAVIVTPRRALPPEPGKGGASRRTPGAKEGKEGRDFEEYNRTVVPNLPPAPEPFLFTARAPAGTPPGGQTGPAGSLPGATPSGATSGAAPSWAVAAPGLPPMSGPPASGWNIAPHLAPAAASGPSAAAGAAPARQARSPAPAQQPLPAASNPPAASVPQAAASHAGQERAHGAQGPLPNPPLRRGGGALKVLVIGSGAREHAMASALLRSKRCQVFAIPRHRNPGIVKAATGFRILPETDVQGIVAWARTQKVDLAVIGPETALEAGVADALRAAGIPVASPSQAAAQIETSKTFMRGLMQRYGLGGQLAFHAFNDAAEAVAFLERTGPEWAVKPVGLTGGKGVQVFGDHFHDVEGAKAYVRSIFSGNVGGGAVQFEELAVGEEFTIMAFTDGANVVPMPAVQDHKRLMEGDQGPNTGGMGSYSQADGLLPFLSPSDYGEAVTILQGIVRALAQEGTPYCGAIYGQFMLTATGPKVIEVNARFGDPEAMNALHILESDYLAICEAMVTGTLDQSLVRFRPRATVAKYVVPKGYGEGQPTAGRHIEVDEFNIRRAGGTVYYASIEQQPMGPFATLNSRTLAVLGEGASITEAELVCSKALAHIHGQGLYVRHDIGTQALLEKRVRHMQEVRPGHLQQAR